jgi:hypothetical protein
MQWIIAASIECRSKQGFDVEVTFTDSDIFRIVYVFFVCELSFCF